MSCLLLRLTVQTELVAFAIERCLLLQDNHQAYSLLYFLFIDKLLPVQALSGLMFQVLSLGL